MAQLFQPKVFNNVRSFGSVTSGLLLRPRTSATSVENAIFGRVKLGGVGWPHCAMLARLAG
jgi:hypothetical protein